MSDDQRHRRRAGHSPATASHHFLFASSLRIDRGFRPTPAERLPPDGLEPRAPCPPSSYIYGYLNRIASSRRLEREAQRNVELMWLTGRLAPDFKTIADFRHDNGEGIRNVCRRFVQLCRDLKLFTQAIVAIDSSKFKAVNSRDRNFTPGKVDKRQEQIEESVQRYLSALETADRTQPAEVEAKTERLREKISTLREQMQRMDTIREELKKQPDEQISLTDPDARSMGLAGQGHRHGRLQRPSGGWSGRAPPS